MTAWTKTDLARMQLGLDFGLARVAVGVCQSEQRNDELGTRERDGRRWADIVNDGLRQTSFDFTRAR